MICEDLDTVYIHYLFESWCLTKLSPFDRRTAHASIRTPSHPAREPRSLLYFGGSSAWLAVSYIAFQDFHPPRDGLPLASSVAPMARVRFQTGRYSAWRWNLGVCFHKHSLKWRPGLGMTGMYIITHCKTIQVRSSEVITCLDFKDCLIISDNPSNYQNDVNARQYLVWV